MSHIFKSRPETIFNFILMLLGLAIIVASLGLGFGTLKKPSSGLFPFLSGLIIFSHGILLVILPDMSKKGESLFTKNEIKTFFLMIITFILWLILISFLGYILITFVATLFLSKVMRLKGWLKPLMLSVGTTGLCYFLFDFCLYSDLPRGFLG